VAGRLADRTHKVTTYSSWVHSREQVTELPGINNPEDISGVIEAPNAIEDDGRFQRVIGDNPNGPGEIIISIIGGTIVAASSPAVYNDDCGATINIDNDVGEEGNPEHSLRDGKPIDEITTLIEVLENPTRIVDGNGKRYYLKRLRNNKVILVVTQLESRLYQEL
jgi:hypothetical protein